METPMKTLALLLAFAAGCSATTLGLGATSGEPEGC
jgi:hypothetical protein